LVGAYDLYLVALKGAGNGKAADPSLRGAADAALTAVVEAWRHFCDQEKARCGNAASVESPLAAQDGRHCHACPQTAA
jgi:hypothetical protein